MAIVKSEMYAAGFSLGIDKLVLALSQMTDLNHHRSVVDLVVYVLGARPPLKEVTHILKSLWNAGIKSCFIEAMNLKEDEDSWAKDLGANHILVFGEDGCLRVKSWMHDRYFEKTVTRMEIIEYLKKNLNADVTAVSENVAQNLAITRNTSTSNISNKNYESSSMGLPTLDVSFVTSEKFNASKRKRLENQIEQKLMNVMQKFNKKENFSIFAVELEITQIKLLIGCIDPNPKEQSQSEWDATLEK
jgi:eukaryotic translation initiation factor 2-alpha kinase 4